MSKRVERFENSLVSICEKLHKEKRVKKMCGSGKIRTKNRITIPWVQSSKYSYKPSNNLSNETP